MISSSRASEKKIPSFKELEEILPVDMICFSCKSKMSWNMAGGKSNVMSLQHDRSGRFRMICMSCNARHPHYPGDDFYKRDVNKKLCQGCNTELELNCFGKGNKFFGVSSNCKKCQAVRKSLIYRENKPLFIKKFKIYYKKNKDARRISDMIYRLKNKEKVSAKHRAYYLSHKENFKKRYMKNREKILAYNKERYQNKKLNNKT